MDGKKNSFNTIDEYISQFSINIQEKLKEIRKIIKETAPEASEKISYQMPTFYLLGNLIHFAAFKNHIGLYPTPSGIENFGEELKGYKTSKGAIQLPIDKPIPYNLIIKIVKFRVAENIEKNESKKKKIKKWLNGWYWNENKSNKK